MPFVTSSVLAPIVVRSGAPSGVLAPSKPEAQSSRHFATLLYASVDHQIGVRYGDGLRECEGHDPNHVTRLQDLKVARGHRY